jgi:hypothetical protein
MSSNKQEGPAFPIWTGDMSIEGNPGLTKREYIAIEAMKGLLSNRYTDYPMMFADRIAKDSITLADEMLKQLEEK